jgi:hypothetical protein
MTHTFKVGDHVDWNSEAGQVRSMIKKIVRAPVTFKGYTVRASKEEPQHLIKSDRTDHPAMNKRTAFRKVRSARPGGPCHSPVAPVEGRATRARRCSHVALGEQRKTLWNWV